MKLFRYIKYVSYFDRYVTMTIELRDINVTLPHSTLQNGSLYVHVLLGPHGCDLTHFSLRDHITIINVPVTRHKIPSATKFNLVTGDYEVTTICTNNLFNSH